MYLCTRHPDGTRNHRLSSIPRLVKGMGGKERLNDEEVVNIEADDQTIGNSAKISRLERMMKEANKKIKTLESELMMVSGMVKKLVGKRDGPDSSGSLSKGGGRIAVSVLI